VKDEMKENRCTTVFRKEPAVKRLGGATISFIHKVYLKSHEASQRYNP
jgi:hypothetical protein